MALSLRQNRRTLGGALDVRSGGGGSFLPLAIVVVLGFLLAEYVLKALSMQGQWAPLLILGVLVFCAAVVIGNTSKLLLVVVLLGVPFSININLFYNDEMAALNAIGGLYLSVTTLALAVLYGMWFLNAIAKKRNGPRFFELMRSDKALTVYVVLVIVSAFVASDRMLGLFEAFLLLQYFLLYMYLRHAMRTRQDVKFVITLLLIGMLVETLVMFALPLIGNDVTIMSIRARIDGNGRVGGTVGGPNGAAAFMTLLIAPALGFLVSRVNRPSKLLGFACVLFGGGALILTLSRGGWIGFAVSAVVFGVLALRRRWLRPLPIIGLVVVALLVGLVFQDLIVARLTGPDDGAAYSRWPLMQIASGMIADQPLLGVGANNFALHIDDYAVGPLAGEWLSTVHNRYLLLWAESGVIALVAYLLFLGVTLRRGWHSYLRNDPFLSPIALGLMAAVSGLMVHMLVDFFRSGPPTELFFIVAALLACIDRLLRMEALEEA